MRGPFHLREAGVRHLLSHDGCGQDEVLDEIGHEPLHRAEERLVVRRQLPELLRCLRGDRRLPVVAEWRVPRHPLLAGP